MKYLLHVLSYLCILTTVVSCDKFTDIHKEYIEEGEIIYAVKPDSVVFIAGKERLMMRLWMENGQNIKEVIVSWNSGQDSMVLPMKLNPGRDSIDVPLNDLEEKSYSFNIYTMDNFGHRSLTYTTFGTTYGDTYAGTLQNRRVKKVSLTEQTGVVDWFAKAEGMIFNEVRFINRRGTDTIVRFHADSFWVHMDVAGSAEFQYRSLYIPEAEAIDTFTTAWTLSAEKFPEFFTYDRSTWKVLSVSDETASDGGGKNTLIDGNLGSYWHSQWDPNDVDPPHWAIIDMKSVKNIAYFTIYRRGGNTDAKTAQFFLGNTSDPNGVWTLAGEGVFGSGDMLRVDNTGNASGRYLKINLPDSNRPPFTAIAEVYAFGK
ncbi:DUF4998 domain-containing protein [Chitinophaga pollutisoli]|uniref:DUF4998 domain-containing protein n=1 Tax=Chitinophaga pollutisoli TaxID=3133966 RepID=A0ABZ2YRA2_9BACT